jgi:hypothetical protein
VRGLTNYGWRHLVSASSGLADNGLTGVAHHCAEGRCRARNRPWITTDSQEGRPRTAVPGDYVAPRDLIWLVLSGFWLALAYAFAGLIMCVLVITIPFGVASFRLAAYVLWPFGCTRRRSRTPSAVVISDTLCVAFDASEVLYGAHREALSPHRSW